LWITGSDRFEPGIVGRATYQRWDGGASASGRAARVEVDLGVVAPSRPRGLVVLEDERAVPALLAGLDPADVLVASDAPSPPLRGIARIAVRRLDRALGRGLDAVVLDLRGRIDADAIGRAEGLVRAGGALVLLLPGAAPGDPTLAIAPFSVADVGTRFFDRLRREIDRTDARWPVAPLRPAERAETGTAEQAALVGELGSALASRSGALVSIVADRGRGKSTALGLGIARALDAGPLRIAVAAADDGGEVFRWAPAGVERAPATELPSRGGAFYAIVIDEAAQLPVPLLVRIVEAHAEATIAMATTARGYEGTGRGYVLRFLAWARASGRPLVERTLIEPIRFAAGDPLERFVHRLLLLDAEPGPPIDGPAVHEVASPDRLAADETLLRETFGLLVHAHYRTSPSDLVRMLDAPNLRVHVLRAGGHVVAASLVAREGRLPPETCEAMARGDLRIRGQALADTLVTHAQRPHAGSLDLLRSVRIATHPELRSRGLGRQLVEAIHAAEPADAHGTVFGATADLVRFRRSLGYEPVRLGVSRGARSGEPSVVMLRPSSAAALDLVRSLRDDLARDLPDQLRLFAAEGGLPAELVAALQNGLPRPAELPEDEIELRVRRYVEGAQPSSAALHSLCRYVDAHPQALAALAHADRALLVARLLERRGWHECAVAAGLPSPGAAMRALRPAVARLLSGSAGGRREPS
jgi:tRNA(Met) cytidine acetyltransferase